MVVAVYPRYRYLSTRLHDATTLTVVIILVITLGTSHLNERHRLKMWKKENVGLQKFYIIEHL